MENLFIERDSFRVEGTFEKQITILFTYITLYEDDYEAYANRTNDIIGNNAVNFLAPILNVEIMSMEDEEPQEIVNNGTVLIQGYENVQLS